MIPTSTRSGAGVSTSPVTVTGSGRGIRTLVEPVGTSQPGGRSGSGTVSCSSTCSGAGSGPGRSADGAVRFGAGAGSGGTTGAAPGSDVVVDEAEGAGGDDRAGVGADGVGVVRVGTGCAAALFDGTAVARRRGATEALTVPVGVVAGVVVATTVAVGALFTGDGITCTCPGRSGPADHTTPTTPAATTAAAATPRTERLPKTPPVECFGEYGPSPRGGRRIGTAENLAPRPRRTLLE